MSSKSLRLKVLLAITLTFSSQLRFKLELWPGSFYENYSLEMLESTWIWLRYLSRKKVVVHLFMCLKVPFCVPGSSFWFSSCFRLASLASTRPLWTTTRMRWRRRRNAAMPTASSRRYLRSVYFFIFFTARRQRDKAETMSAKKISRIHWLVCRDGISKLSCGWTSAFKSKLSKNRTANLSLVCLGSINIPQLVDDKNKEGKRIRFKINVLYSESNCLFGEM